MEKGHNLIRERRQGSCNNADLRMCNGCHGFFDRKQIYRHKKCIDLSGTSSGSVNFTKSWRSAESLRVTEEFKSVIDSFRNDKAGRLCQRDSLIILFGKRLWAKSIKKGKHVVMSEMKVLANLIPRMRVVSLNDNLCAQNILEREHFDTLCDSIRHLTTRENGEIKASLKLKIGYVLKTLIKTAKGHYIQANEMEKIC